MRRAVLITRHAISPRLAMRILLNIVILYERAEQEIRENQKQRDAQPPPENEAFHISAIELAFSLPCAIAKRGSEEIESDKGEPSQAQNCEHSAANAMLHSAASNALFALSGSSPCSAVSPSLANSAASLSSPALAVVSSLSPVKIEFAPAMKHSACVASLIDSRPADSRTMLIGIVIRATATVRTNSISSILESGVSANISPSTVPLTGTSALTCTLGMLRQGGE